MINKVSDSQKNNIYFTKSEININNFQCEIFLAYFSHGIGGLVEWIVIIMGPSQIENIGTQSLYSCDSLI